MRFLASLLMAFALLFSPLAMKTGGSTAMAHTTMASMNEGCAGMHHSSADDQKSDMKLSCAMACAAVLTAPAALDAQAPAGTTSIVSPAKGHSGTWPEGETPPPRITSEI